MRSSIFKMVLLLVPILSLALAGSGDGTADFARRNPSVFLWAWEHPQDLRFLKGRDAGVAYLAATFTLAGDRVEFRPRMQPLRVDPSTPLAAVFRLESSALESPAYGRARIDDLAERIGTVARAAGVHAVQIDFDAVRSQRSFYRDLLWEIRDRLPATVSMSVTALASWCIGDRWMTGLPVGEAVPMLFDMGVDRESVLHRLDTGEGLREPLCRTSAGVATYDFPPSMPPVRNLYLFHDGPWTEAVLDRMLREVRR